MNSSNGANGDNGERTFANQDQLPSLPVPELRQTLKKYLDSVSVHLSADDFQRTKRIVENFERGVGADLHKRLEEKAKKEKNWLEKWWEDYGYHLPRYPIFPHINFGGAAPKYDHWPPRPGSAVPRSALTIYWTLRYWDTVRKEQLKPHHQRGIKWCMNQVHRLFNTCRIPGEFRDELKFHFKTIYEGQCPSHIVVMDNGRFWRLEVLNPNTGDLYTPVQFEKALHEIHKAASQRPNLHAALGALTCLDRTSWWKERERLIALSPENARNFQEIETAICMLSFTNEEPANNAQIGWNSICCDPRYIWADKNFVWLIHKNGLACSNADHSYVDAIVVLQMSAYVDAMFQKYNFSWQGDKSIDPYPHAEELKFSTDERTVDAVNLALETWKPAAEDINVDVFIFDKYGNDLFRSRNVYGDTVVQLALQLTYLRLHSRPGATYETATTKRYFHGRTETVRSCTSEAIDWAKSMLNPEEKEEIKRNKFLTAIARHNRLMAEAMNGQGCDRHLLGLKILAQESGLAVPEIFTDPAWKISGGDGNFVVSSSFIGYSDVWGGVTAMCPDGYGTFYHIQSKKITFFLTNYKSSKESNLALWRKHLNRSLCDITETLEALPVKVESSKI